MCKLSWIVPLHLVLGVCSLNACITEKMAHESIESPSYASHLFIAQINLPETLLENIRTLSEEIKHSWPDAKYYRETIDFGKVFPALEEGSLFERPIPGFIGEIRDQLFEHFKSQINEDISAESYDNCIISIYKFGNGIAPHIDRNFEWANKSSNRKYYFGESIIGLIVEPDTLQNLFFENPTEGEKSRFYLDEKPGTAFMFQDSLRNEWKHGLLPIERERISMTFRRVIVKDSTLGFGS
ncbi:MAG: hypothetical protein H0U49_07620 [Parachlamydiaceae bacterium]|nr:hypothetical protein [Parachlamydiaceae bacterium]